MSRNVPNLRFKGFEDEWKEKKLINFLSESRIPGSNGSKAKKLTVKLWAKGVVPKKEIYEGSDNTKYYTRKAGQLIYGKLDFLNCAFGIVPDHLDGYESTVDAPAFDIKNINPYFLFSKIIQKNFYKRNGDIADGSRKAKRIHSDVFLNMSIKVPSLQEQEKIANFLSKVDSIIEKQEKKVEYWNSYKKGMMQKIFSQKIRFKDENGRDYPEWEEEKLGGIGQTYTGLSGKTKDDFGFGNGKYITYVNIFKNTKVDINMFDLVDIKKDEKQNKVLKGDILFTASSETPNEVGMASVCDNNIENLYLNSFCFGFRLNSKKDIDYIFIGYLLRSPSLRKKISILAQGSTRYNLSKSEFMKIKIQIPCLEEQRKIVNFLSNIDNII
uniref:restriction endonuclease subunit S n=2 Tax=Clostridium perfringens TaxID=1502 RepID=UPI0039E7AD7F